MKEILAELEKIIVRQSESGFIGKINFLKESNDEIVGHLFINTDKVSHFQFLNQKGLKALEDFIYSLAKGLRPKFILEPELPGSHLSSFEELEHRDFVVSIHQIFEKVQSLMDYIPPSRTLVKLRKKVFAQTSSLTVLEFLMAILVVKFRDVGKIVLESDYSEIETLAALISLRKKGCLKVLS